MDRCSRCGAETQLFDNGNPICLKCESEIDAARKRTACNVVAQHEPQSQQAQAAHN
jgi:hypothetical protein